MRELIVGGGLAGDVSALKRRADLLRLPIVAVSERETSSIGAAILAGVAGGVFPDLDSPRRRSSSATAAGMTPGTPTHRIGAAKEARHGALANLVEG